MRSDRAPYEQYRVEFLHSSPDVVVFHDFVTDREAAKLRDMAASKVRYVTRRFAAPLPRV